MIIFDADGTLADCEHRRHFIKEPKCACGLQKNIHLGLPRVDIVCPRCDEWEGQNWDAFFEACDKDTPIEHVCELIRMYTFHRNPMEIWSGRSESVREKTLKWIEEHVFWGNPLVIPTLRMRPVGDYTPDDVLKERWLDESLAQGKTIKCVFDDRPKVIRMWRRRGIFVFNCSQNDEEF